ncbi:hypothetical protein ACFPER_10055 [Agromyces aurantiacus]|uniref:Sensor domain-containing protein n=1 Tax=Agromyces aurantiacus TaxID=165814 RepID=A0ABV9R6F9_9MICO|nr:hypothetical protein [Agromyces aurantiacus]MBM7503818.1 hypothetical protein [Agromyces aurantiacus]
MSEDRRAAAPEGPPPSEAPETATRVARRRRSRTWYAVGGAVGVAVLGATASAVITPERIDALFGRSDAAGATPTSTVAPIEYQTVQHTSGAIALDVPEEWGARDARWDVDEHPGAAMRVGFQIESVTPFGVDGAYAGASVASARAVDATSMSEPERRDWLRGYIVRDWTVDGCVPRPDPGWEKAGWTLETTRWEDCASFEDSRLVEFAALHDDGEVVLVGQISLTAETPDAVAEHLIESIAVQAEKLPSGTTTGDLVIP